MILTTNNPKDIHGVPLTGKALREYERDFDDEIIEEGRLNEIDDFDEFFPENDNYDY